MTVVDSHIAPSARLDDLGTHREWLRQSLWFCAACVAGFLLPFVFADVLAIRRDVYYAIYIVFVFAFFLAWARTGGTSVSSLVRRNWQWALALGGLAAAILAFIAFTFEPSAHPGGLRFAAAIAWRGVAYGAADGLLLGAFPVLAVFAVFPFRRGRAHALRTIGTGALALLATLAITTAYHLGYPDFRGSKLTSPMRGSVIWAAPTLLTLNPIGSVTAHVGLHVAAVVHSYDGTTFLPPHANATAAPTIELHPCLITTYTPAKCGTLIVAENPADPGGPHIGLNVAVVPAANGEPKPDPLFWFAGWGSAGVTDDASSVISALVTVNEDRDIVFIDQRGTGSSRLECRLPDQSKLLANGALSLVSAAAQRCAERIGPNLRHYTTAVAVDDFDQVRAALGYDKINIYGGSYGVTSGQVYLSRHGSHVRSAVFDSGSLLDVHIFERGASNAQRALDLLFTRCAADSACHSAYPDLRRQYERAVARVSHAPIPIPGTKATLNPLTFAMGLDDLIAYTPGKAEVPRAIHLVATGQIGRLAALIPPTTENRADLAYMALIQCSEPWASWRPAEVNRLTKGTFARRLMLLNTSIVDTACEALPKGDVPAEVGKRVHSSVPVLFLNGNEDSADPPANVANARRELPNSRTVIFAAAGHGQLGLPCAQVLIADFVERASTRGLATACARTAALREFDTAP